MLFLLSITIAAEARMTSQYQGRTHLKGSKVSRVASIAAFGIFAVVTVLMVSTEGWGVWSVIGLLITLFAMVGIVEAFSSFIKIKNDVIEFRRNFLKRTVKKEVIKSANWAKGCPTVLVLKDGTKLELPDVQGEGLTNSINAWLRSF